MTIVQDDDYVFCPSAAYIGSIGVGRGCLVGTDRFLLGLPERVDSATWNQSITTTTFSIDGSKPGDAIQGIAELETADLETFENILQSLGTKCQAAVLVDLQQQKRLKLRAGLCTKGIYWSNRESGPGWQGYGLGTKEIAERWIRFYANHPIAV